MKDLSSTKAFPRQRASLACQSCNQRKTKCDVGDVGTPCTKCTKGERQCALVTSRRGKYDRSSMGGCSVVSTSGSNLPIPAISASPPSGEPLYNAPSNTSSFDIDNSPAQTLVSLSGIPNPTEHPAFSSVPHSNLVDPALLNGPHFSNGKQREEGEDTPAEEDEPSAWVNLFSSTSQDRNQTHDSSNVMYLSELFTLSHLMRHKWEGQGQEASERVHFIGSAEPPGGKAGASRLNVDQVRSLTEAGCFTLPPAPVLDAIVAAYFYSTHPIYPVVNKTTFLKQYESVFSGGVSLLLLWAVLYVGSTTCSMAALKNAGFATRFIALETFYSRGHALYSLGFEDDGVVVVQFAFLISQVWSGIEDSYSWAGKASTQALCLGMHRSTANSKMLMSERRMWRRIWWCVYIRDRHSSVATGRPYIIIDAFTDVELPEPDDFEAGEDAELFLESVKLAMLVGDVALARLERRITDERRIELQATTYKKMLKWHDALPKRLMCASTNYKDIFVTFLHLSYHCWVVHLHRPTPGTTISNPIASDSATAATRLFEDLLQHSEVIRVPQFVNTCLFAALGQLLLDRKIGGDTNRRLGGNRLAVCMLVARELSQSRPVANWVKRMFTSLETKTPLESAIPQRDATGNGDSDGASTSAGPRLQLNNHSIFNAKTSFLDCFKGDDGQSFFDESGFQSLLDFDSTGSLSNDFWDQASGNNAGFNMTPWSA